MELIKACELKGDQYVWVNGKRIKVLGAWPNGDFVEVRADFEVLPWYVHILAHGEVGQWQRRIAWSTSLASSRVEVIDERKRRAKAYSGVA